MINDKENDKKARLLDIFVGSLLTEKNERSEKFSNNSVLYIVGILSIDVANW